MRSPDLLRANNSNAPTQHDLALRRGRVRTLVLSLTHSPLNCGLLQHSTRRLPDRLWRQRRRLHLEPLVGPQLQLADDFLRLRGREHQQLQR